MAESEVGSGTDTPDGALFGVFLEKKKRRWPLFPLLILGVIGAWAVALQRTAGNHTIVTKKGFATVRRGMSTGQVQSLLGSPIDSRRTSDGRDCLRYGHPRIDGTFLVYSACYQDGQLKDFSERQYTSWVIGPNGLPMPAPGAESEKTGG